MSIIQYLQLIRRHIAVLVLLPLLFAAGGYVGAKSQPKVYRATAHVLLRPNDPNERVGTGGSNGMELLSADRIVQAQADIARGPGVLRQAAASLANTTKRELEQVVTVTAISNANLLYISADDETPDRSVALANGVATAFIENRRLAAVSGLERAISDIESKLVTVQADLARLGNPNPDVPKSAEFSTAQAQFQSLSVQLTQLSIDKELKRGEAELTTEASTPEAPISPKPLRTAALAGLVGLMGLVGVILLRDRLDTRLRSREDAEEASGLSTLAEVPYDRIAEKKHMRIAAEDEPFGPVAESVRSLRVSLRFLGLEQPTKVILVTSALPGDGKSTVSINLAHSYADAGWRTLLVSADLRRPRLDEIASVSSDRGLVELLNDMANIAEWQRDEAAGRSTRLRVERPGTGPAYILSWCQQESENLWLLPAGRRIDNPVEILGSTVAKDFFVRAAQDFDMVIVDSPPLLAFADAVVLSQFVDGTIVVTSLRHTHRHALVRAMELLRNGQPRILGLVLNRVRHESGGGYRYTGASPYRYSSSSGAPGDTPVESANGRPGLVRRLTSRGRNGRNDSAA